MSRPQEMGIEVWVPTNVVRHPERYVDKTTIGIVVFFRMLAEGMKIRDIFRIPDQSKEKLIENPRFSSHSEIIFSIPSKIS